MAKGRIIDVEDGGSVWVMFYKPENGSVERVVFDWRQFANFYEGTSGRSFYHDYDFGAGSRTIKDYFKGKTLIVSGEEFEERVALEERLS